MGNSHSIVLGAGMTGLAAGLASGFPVYESEERAGGICSSYYLKPGEDPRHRNALGDSEAYRFEIGGGHWIFGAEAPLLRFIKNCVPVKSYQRRSGIYFSKNDVYVPYPLQNNLRHLPSDVVAKALIEIASAPTRKVETMHQWVIQNFGPTLTEIFFGPFHELYTAGLWHHIAPQDAYKSPFELSHAIRGALQQSRPVGYNATFVYPREGLNTLVQAMAAKCTVNYNKKAVEISLRQKKVMFEDGDEVVYKTLISTIPLDRMIKIAGLDVAVDGDPATSVLVLNIGATRGRRTPKDHWLYVPDSPVKYHRLGFYSNVDTSFLPACSRKHKDRVSIYVERAFRDGLRPADSEIKNYAMAVVAELAELGFIGEAEVVDPTWIDVAYTWSWPQSDWKRLAVKALEDHRIYQAGRYGNWRFQGIAESIKEGLVAGSALK